MYKETHALDMPAINTSTLQGDGIADLGQSSFKADPFGFDVLANKVYSKKPTAIFREVATNGVDGNKAIGLEHIPILVKFPNELSPSFFIQDCGPGLSEEQVKELILVFFASSKRDLSGMTGQFGVGAKSPFAYATEFQIECAHAGMFTSYLFYKDSDRIPKMKRLTNPVPVSSDFPHGVRVTIPVKPEDYAKFESEGMEVLRWFEVPPTIKGCAKGLDIPKFKVKLTDTISAVSSQQSVPSSNVWMSNVRYPVNFNSILSGANKPEDVSDEDFNVFKKKFQAAASLLESVKFILKAPSRAVDIPISREHLEETAKTIGFVMNEVVQAGEVLTGLIQRALTEKTEISWDGLLAQREQDNDDQIEVTATEDLDVLKCTILSRRNKYKVASLLNAFLDEELARRLNDRLELQLTQTVIMLPRWAGDVKGESPLWSLDFNKPLLVDLNEEPLDLTELVEFPRKPFVALSILSRSDKTVQFEAVEHGQTKSGGVVGISINKETSIFIADAPQASQRFKQNNFSSRASALLVSCSNVEMAELYAELLSEALCGVPVRLLSELPLVKRKKPTNEAEARQQIQASKVMRVATRAYTISPFELNDYEDPVELSTLASDIENVCFVFRARSTRKGVNLGIRGTKHTSTTQKKKAWGGYRVSEVVPGSAASIYYAQMAEKLIGEPEYQGLDDSAKAEVRSMVRMTKVYCISVAEWRLLKQAFPEAKTFAELMVENFGSSLTKMQSLFKTAQIVREYVGPNPRQSYSKEDALSFQVFRRIFADAQFHDELKTRCLDEKWKENCVDSGWLGGLQNALAQFGFFESSRSDSSAVELARNLSVALSVLKDVEGLPCDKETIQFLQGTQFSNTDSFVEIFAREKVNLLDNDQLQRASSQLLFELMQFCFK